MTKLECGICRSPFIKEYFENDPIINELFNTNTNNNTNRNALYLRQNNNNNRNQRINNNRINNYNRNGNINNIRINNNRNNNITRNRVYHYRNNYNGNLNYNIINTFNTNRVIIRVPEQNMNTNNDILCGLFTIIFEPNKTYCIIVLLTSIFCCGFGTFLIGLKKKSCFYILLGIIQCFCFYFFSIYASYIEIKGVFGRYPHPFFKNYFKFLASLFYLSSIYIALFRNFLFFNPRKINYNEKKEKGIFIIFLNLLIGGSGTIVAGILLIITEQKKLCYKINLIGFGIIQFSGYIISLFGISLIPENKRIIIGFLFFYGGLCYIFSIYIAYRLYKKIIR